MDTTIQKLYIEKNNLIDRNEKIESALESFQKVCDFDEFKNFEDSPLVLKLKGEMVKNGENIKKFRTAIKSFQEICKHDMKYDGHDSHKNYYKCSICGYENDY